MVLALDWDKGGKESYKLLVGNILKIGYIEMDEGSRLCR